MRYPYAETSMAVIISDIDNLQEFIQNHRKDLYILLTGSRLLQLVDNEKIKEVTDRNLSWRKDLYINISSSRMIVLFSKEVIDQIKNDFKTKIEKEPFADILNKVTEEIIDLHVLETELVPIFVWENLLLQEYMLRTYNYLLGENRPDSVRQLNKLREEISDAIEEYLNVRVWAFPYAREIVEKAKPIMSIDELYDSLRKRLDFVESIITTHYNVSINRLLILLTIITAGLQLFEVPRLQVTQLTNLDGATTFVLAFFVTILLPIIVYAYSWIKEHIYVSSMTTICIEGLLIYMSSQEKTPPLIILMLLTFIALLIPVAHTLFSNQHKENY
jgi:hypothetical protein